MRINKYIAKAGIASRRKADDLVAAGRVKVNGKVLTEAGYDVELTEKVEVDGKLISLEDYFYIKLYKPVGYITSNFDPYNDKDLNDLVDIDSRFFAAGRLDKDSHGLLIIANDGDFTNKLIHPSNEISKEYIVKSDRRLSLKDMEKFKNGLDIGNGEITSKSEIYELSDKVYRVIISQGYNRQIRRMFAALNSTVVDLKRIRIGDVELKDLKPYESVKFNKAELEFVKQIKG